MNHELPEVTAHIECPGEPNAGIQADVWEAGPFIFETSYDREVVRSTLADAFGTIAGGRVRVLFSDELPE